MDFRLTGENEDMLALFEEFGKKVLEPWGPRAEAGEHPGEAIQAMAEAGGFVGNVTTMVTLPQITSAVDIPVIAADTGENYGRTVVFYPETGEYLIRAIGREPRKI